MGYSIYLPSPLLKPYVRFFWIFELDLPGGEPYVYRSMADGCAEIIFHYNGTFNELTENGQLKQPVALLHAQSKSFKRFITLNSFGIFGAYLYPYAITQMWRLSAEETSDLLINLHDLLGKEADELVERILGAANNLVRINILAHFLEKKLLYNKPKDETIFSAVRETIYAAQMQNINELAGEFCLSKRQFERRFKAASGFSPKLYTRIIRFHNAMNAYGKDFESLTRLAYHCGYYDQSHFIHDFKDFSGYHPTKYFFDRTEGIEWREK